jgi:hypothetical protein
VRERPVSVISLQGNFSCTAVVTRTLALALRCSGYISKNRRVISKNCPLVTPAELQILLVNVRTSGYSNDKALG